MGANPSSASLLEGGIGSPENTCAQRVGHNEGDVLGVESGDDGGDSRCGSERVVGGFCAHGDGSCLMGEVPLGEKAVDCVGQSVLRHGVEEADKVVVW